jgi:hypothetical protein
MDVSASIVEERMEAMNFTTDGFWLAGRRLAGC